MRACLLLLLAMMAVLPVGGQEADYCPGWRNTTSFNSGNLGYTWTARVGERLYNENNPSDTTTGYRVMSTCVTAPDIIGHENITSSAYNSGSDNRIIVCGHDFFDANDRRFQIITQDSAGIDQFTVSSEGEGMPRICPGYTTSVRLGDMRSTGDAQNVGTHVNSSNRGAEALFYTMYVTPMNSLLIINYAVVARRFSHTAFDAGEFLIRVVRQNDNGSWPNAPINDSLWYKVSAPTFNGNEMPMGWEVGANNGGTPMHDWPCTYAYKPWAKVAISLNEYINQNVRIEMYTSDCIFNADPIYAYIAGDYRAMRINTVGCSAAESPSVDTLVAPEGLMRYKWYVTTMGAEEDLFNTEYMNTVRFRPLTTLLDSNIYAPTLSDFILTEGPHAGDTVSKQTFMCMMYSALDPKKPFGSRVYVNLENHKPIVQMHYITDCNLTASFTNQSYALSDVPINPDSTRWVFFADSTDAHPLDTMWGDTVSYHFESEGYYRVELRASLQGMDCSSIKAQICHLMTPHELPIILVEGRLCEGETCVAWTTGDEELAREWRVDDSLLAVTCYPFDTIRFTPRIGFHTLSLTTTTGLCFATTDTMFRVFGDDTITSSANGKPICVGDSVTLSILGIEHPVWSSDPYDSTLVGYENENVVTVVPKETTTYTVQPMGDSRCLQVPTSVTINVSPYPVPVVWTDRYALALTRPSLHIEDRSPFSNSSHWIFSDGQTADGAVVNHTFELIGDSVTITLHTCNGSGCCVDTTVVIPVEINLLWIPNVFTPDQPQNNLFQLVTSLHIIYYEIWIYNRLGLLVYHGNDINQAWNGIDLHGNACPQGAYVYHYVFSCMQDPTRRHTGDGTVTLLR